MKKIFLSILSILVLLQITNCAGYKPIFQAQNLQFEIAEYSIKGDKVIGNRIYSKLYNLSQSSKSKDKAISVTIEVNKKKIPTVKNSAGKITEYKITLNTKILLSDYLTNTKIVDDTFVNSITYKVQDQYSETVYVENQTIENLVNKTYQELLMKFSENIK
tara:strand:+ start:154 stop:636 length:483 start_codon:yes stop_codon:yes gene_type:complete